MEISQKEIRKKAITNGLVLGLVLLVITKILPAYSIAYSKSFWVIILLPIIFMCVVVPLIAAYFSFHLRKQLGGYWLFRQATTGIFLMFFTAYIISTTGNYAFGKFVAPGIDEKMKKSLITGTTEMMENQGMDQEQIDNKIAEIENQFATGQEISAGGIIRGIAFAIIIVFVAALIFAAIFKKDPPLFTSHTEEQPQ